MFPQADDRWHGLTGIFLLLFAACLPHSIAATQISAGVAGILWLVSLAVKRRRPFASKLYLPVLVFVVVTMGSTILSLDPTLSMSRSRSVLLILILPLVADNVRKRSQVALMVGTLLGSATLGAIPELWEKAVGRGVEIVSLNDHSPLTKAGLIPRDTILNCVGQSVNSPEALVELVSGQQSQTIPCEGIRGGILPIEFQLDAPARGEKAFTGDVLQTGRGIRATGTYGHWVTYAEMLLLVGSLAFGLWLACPSKRSGLAILLVAIQLLLVGALGATFTRASWGAFVFGVMAVLCFRLRWRGRALTLVLAFFSIFLMNTLLERWRGVGFYDPADMGDQYRQLMWADGMRLISEYPWFGVGMDSSKTAWQELGLRAWEKFGWQLHFHSTPIQLAVERGLLGLTAWVAVVATYLWVLVRTLHRSHDWMIHGIVLGILGGVFGFLISGLVHYNFGDSEVVMVFWLLAGIALGLERLCAHEERLSQTS